MTILHRPEIGAARHNAGHHAHLHHLDYCRQSDLASPDSRREVCHPDRVDVTIALSGCERSGYTGTCL
jgi:hypothetical protein